MSPAKRKAKAKRNHTKKSVSGHRDKGDYVPMYYNEKKSYANVVLIVIVVIIILYMLFK